MKTRIGVVAGMLLFGGVVAGWAQAPADRAEQVARLKARLEVAELRHEADRAILKESILLLKRAERDLPLEQHRSEREHKEQAERLNTLKKYVHAEETRFEEEAIQLESARRELSKATQVSQAPAPAGSGSGSNARTRTGSAPRPAGEDADRLAREADEAQIGANLLQAQLMQFSSTLDEQMKTLASLEVRAASAEGKPDPALAKELEAARARFAEVRARYLDLKAKHAREMRTVFRLQTQAGPGGAFQ